MDLHVMRSPESENHIFNVRSVCMYVCVSAISIAQKQITAETSNLVFDIIQFETFYEDKTNTMHRAQKNILIYYGI